MKTFAEQAAEARKNKSARTLTPRYFEFKAKGDEVCGVFISKAEIASSTGEGNYNQYLFETDDGNVKFHLGHAADTEVAAVFKPGIVYAIVFEGKVDIGKGRRVNKFDIVEVGPVGE